MATYYACYRVDSSSSRDNQYEEITASAQGKAKELIEKRYPGCKITWPHSPTNSISKPSWYKG
jgi:hypothetical protein